MRNLWQPLKRLVSRKVFGAWPLLVSFSLLACRASLLAGEPSFTATLDRDSVVVGETVALSLKFEGSSPKGIPTIPPLPGLAVAGGVSTSVNSSLGPDGVMTSSTSYTVPLLAQQVGDF